MTVVTLKWQDFSAFLLLLLSLTSLIVCASQGFELLTFVSFLCLLREQFLKANAQLTFRCRQLLYELSYIYPIDVVSWGYKFSPAQHIF